MAKITLRAKCKYCGNEYTYHAKGKADAKRMEGGDAVCDRVVCRKKHSRS
jgi:hypothetical protein